jgi:hypothetical protein
MKKLLLLILTAAVALMPPNRASGQVVLSSGTSLQAQSGSSIQLNPGSTFSLFSTSVTTAPNTPGSFPLLDSNGLLPRLGLNASGVTNAGLGQDIYIGIRGDTAAGTGTATDPYDGSTMTKFTALMGGFSANTRVHLLPGTFMLAGGFTAPSGMTIEGQGNGVSTIQLGSVSYVYGNKHDTIYSSNNGITIRNLTIDCNHAALAAQSGGLNGVHQYDSTQGIEIDGNNIHIDNVEVINA